MNWFKTSQQNRDVLIREEAKKIVDTILPYLGKRERWQNTPLPYDYKKGLHIGSLLPKHQDLYLKFIRTVGFGGQKDMGNIKKRDSGNVISIALPMSTLRSAVNYIEGMAYVNSTVGKFFSKPNNYNTLFHEIVHYLYDKETKGKINKNYDYKDTEGEDYYYNHPSEFNAHLQAFILSEKEQGRSMSEMIDNLKKEYWFNKLNDSLKRSAIKRVYRGNIVNLDKE